MSKKLLTIWFLFWGLLRIALSQSVYVPLNHWSYDFVERLEAKGWITGVLNSTKPFSREEMAGYLIQIEKRMTAGFTLNATETEQLEFLRFEFKEEHQRLTGKNGHVYLTKLQKIKESHTLGKLFPGFIYKNNRNLFSVGESGMSFYVDPVFSQRWLHAGADSINGIERVFERTHGARIWGQLGTHVGFFLDVRDTKEWGTRTYPERFDISLPGLGFVNGYGDHIWHDETVAYLVFKLPYFQLQIGKDSNVWGPGRNGALSLSDNATSYDQIKLQSKIWRLKFTYLWGFLRTFPVLLDADNTARPKSIVAHRLDINVAKWLDVGIYETVIFSGRRFEMAYLNPINFYRSAEHFLGDNDNATLGFDFEFLLIPNSKIYGELFIDDLTTTRLGSGWFGNKTAYTVGGLWVDAFKVSNLDARLEYTRTRPFVYTHVNTINTYSHFSTGLGHWIGPNADVLNLRMQVRFSKSFFVAVDVETFRHGANQPNRNVGGDFNQPWQEGDEKYIAALDGDLERRTRFGLQLSYELFRNFYFDLSAKSVSSKNVKLPDSSRGPVSRRQVLFGLSLNR
ncbi:MAG: capsule assembly Wzi family protein [bacterium]